MFDNFIEQVNDVDTFDYVSKVVLELYSEVIEEIENEDEVLKKIVSSRDQMLGRLLVRAMRDKSELQLHYKRLADQFIDLDLVGLIGLN